jgi:hypothetical protein
MQVKNREQKISWKTNPWCIKTSEDSETYSEESKNAWDMELHF